MPRLPARRSPAAKAFGDGTQAGKSAAFLFAPLFWASKRKEGVVGLTHNNAEFIKKVNVT